MTIARLKEVLEQCSKNCEPDMEVKCYVGMSKAVAEKRLKELWFDDEYVFDDFVDIDSLNFFSDTNETIVYIKAKDIE